MQKRFKNPYQYLLIFFYRPSCDQCDTNYVSERIYPAFTLQCSRCWPTRLAGLIKETSPLKDVVSDVAVNLGEFQSKVYFFNTER